MELTVPIDPRFMDLTGRRFGRLKVLEYAFRAGAMHCWLCQCDCGRLKNIHGGNLRRGLSRSCGCLQKERASVANSTHHCAGSIEYKTWVGIKRRCYNRNDAGYPRYGGAGITVCQRWLNSFEAFLSDMGSKPRGLTIERKDGTKGYSPENCKWATLIEQANNKSDNHRVRFRGEELNVVQWATRLGITPKTLYTRLDRGWSLDRALNPTLERRGTK